MATGFVNKFNTMTSVLGIKVSAVNKKEALGTVQKFLHSEKSHYIFTPNPEMIVDATRDHNFKDALNQGDLNLCDGFGLSLFVKSERIPGVDFMVELCALASKERKSIYLLGSGDEEVLIKTKLFLQTKFPQLKIAGVHPGYTIKLRQTEAGSMLTYNSNERDEVTHDIIMRAPDILLVAFGHNKQEQWIVENVPNLPSVRVAMGVGGAFDFLSGKATRAPRFLQVIGLEWLWRLALQPRRIKRILNAVFVFPFLVLRSTIKS